MADTLSWNIVKIFSSSYRECFSYEDVLREFPGKSKVQLSNVLAKMIKSGMLIKLMRGLYYIVPQSADSKYFMPDWHLVAKHLMKGKQYYIAYYSAMQIHGLIVQPSMREIIAIRHKPYPTIKKIKNAEFQFVTMSEKRFFGFSDQWINDSEKVKASDLEKTIVDALTRPELSGGIVEIARAIYTTKEKINMNTFTKYLIGNDSYAAIKRYLFLHELLHLEWTSYHESIINKKGTGFPLLDTSASNQGKWNSRFGLKLNVDENTIKNAIYS